MPVQTDRPPRRWGRRSILLCVAAALLWPCLTPVCAQPRVLRFDRHEVRFGPGNNLCPQPNAQPYSLTTSIANGTLPIDGTRFSCPDDGQTFTGGSVIFDFPATLTGTDAPGGGLTFSQAQTFSLRVAGSWNFTQEWISWHHKGEVEITGPVPSCRKSEWFVPGSSRTGAYPIPNTASACQSTQLGASMQITSHFIVNLWTLYGNVGVVASVKSFYTTDSRPKLRITTAGEIFAGRESEITIEALKADGTVDTSYGGGVRVSLAPESTKGIGQLQSGAGKADLRLSLTMQEGKLRDTLVLQTPKEKLDESNVITPQTVLEGTAIIRAEFESAAGSIREQAAVFEQQVRVRSPLDLKIERFELQQGVIVGDEGPWVKGDTLARLFIGANREEFNKYKAIEGITGRLTIRDQSGRVVDYPITKGKIDNRNVAKEPYIFTPGASGDPHPHGADSLNLFFSTRSFGPAITVDVSLGDVFADKDSSNNSKSRGPLRFADPKPLTIAYFITRLVSGALKSDLPDPADVAREMKFMLSAYPMPSRSIRFLRMSSHHSISRDPSPRNGAEVTMWMNHKNADRNKPRAYVYFVDTDYMSLTGGVGAAGWTQYKTIVVVNAELCDPEIFGACETLAHEIGHVLGLGDTYTGGTHRPDINPRLPNVTPVGNPVERGNFSFFNHEFSYLPKQFIDFMGSSAQGTRYWIDLPTWRHLSTRLAAAGQLEHRPVPEQTGGGFVIVNGFVAKDGTARLGDGYTLSGTNMASTSEGGNHVIETLDGSGSALSGLAFNPEFRRMDYAEDRDEADFSFALPFSATVRQIRLRAGSRILDSKAVTANAPNVRLTSDFSGQTLRGIQTVSWTGSDEDGGSLSYSLFYSPDGELQMPLVVSTAETRYEWDSDQSPAGPSPRLTLMATDGVNATRTESTPFTLPDRAPRVLVLSPADASRLAPGETVKLEGSLEDPEDGFEPDPQLEWTSDIQGPLGTGAIIEVDNLRPGTHRITASGADSLGARGSATIVIHIGSGGAGRCDLNQDSQINVVDVQVLINRILAASGSADINCDGRTDVLDVQRLIGVVQSSAACPSCDATTTLASTTTTTTSLPTTSTSTTTTTATTTTTTTSTLRATTTTSTTTSTQRATTTTTTTTPPAVLARGELEAPVNGQSLSGTVSGSGWAFFQAGNVGVLPTRVEMLIDGVSSGLVTAGVNRPDVRDAFASQGVSVPANAGYTFTWNSATVAAGSHTLSIRAADAAGTTREALYEIARIQINITAPVGNCALFGEDFGNTALPGWSLTNGNWRVVNGKLQAGGIVNPAQVAVARHGLPFPNYFRLTLDIEVDQFNGEFYGFGPYSSALRQTFSLGGRVIDGLGAGWVPNLGVVFLGFDVVQEEFVYFTPNPPVLEPISSLGVQWAASGVTLLVNGTVRATIPASSFGVASITTPQFDVLDLIATGSGTQMRFDNICMGAPTTLAGQLPLEVIRP